jgi:hypothetical protein
MSQPGVSAATLKCAPIAAMPAISKLLPWSSFRLHSSLQRLTLSGQRVRAAAVRGTRELEPRWPAPVGDEGRTLHDLAEFLGE